MSRFIVAPNYVKGELFSISDPKAEGDDSALLQA